MLKLSHAKFAIINCAIFAIVGALIYSFILQGSPKREVIGYFKFLNFENNSMKSIKESDDKSTKTNLPSVKCVPKSNIVFVKTHKCASSTIQNMLMRYAYQNNLTVVLPLEINNNYLSRTSSFNRRSVAKAPWADDGYNILCHHIVYNHEEVKAIMPSNSVYITILREPVSMFESLFSYVRFEKYYHMNIDQFMNNTADITKRMHQHLGRNQMLFDLGFPEEHFNDTAKVKKHLEVMEKRFNLILIAEHFDESLILLKNVLCWDVDDIITFKLNSRKDSKRLQLSNHTKARIHEWSAADLLMYNHFLKIFQQRIKEYGEEQMKKDVEELRNRRKEWFSYCIEGIFDSTKLSKFNKLYSKDVWGFEVKHSVKNETCDNLAIAELQQTEKTRHRQLLRSLPIHLQSKNEYRLLAEGIGPIPDIKNLSHEDRIKVLRVSRMIYPARAAYLSHEMSNKVKLNISSLISKTSIS